MESLRGIFPHTPSSQVPPKRDFLKENVMKIRSIQRMRKKTKDTSEYSNKFTRPTGPSSVSSKLPSKYNENHRSTTNLALCSSKAPITNLRKSLSTMSIHSRDFGVQTVDPEEDEFFLKDSIIRYPSASTIRSGNGIHQAPTTTCSRGHIVSEPEERPRFKSHFHDRRDEHCDKMERHISSLSEYLDKGSINKHQQNTKPTSILKSSSSLQKLSKNSINEFQQQQRQEKRQTRVGSGHRNAKISTVKISDDENESDDEEVENMKERGDGDSKYMELKKQQQLKAAADDPECPDGHIPLTEDERSEALKLAKKRKLPFPTK